MAEAEQLTGEISRETEEQAPPREGAAPGGEEAIAAAVEAARAKWQAEQAALVEEAVAAERQRYDILIREQELARQLGEAGLSPEFAPLLRGGSREEDGLRLEQFKGLLREQLSAAIAQRMRGTEAPREPAPPQGYDRARLRAMSAREINEQWEAIAQTIGQGGNS